MEYNLQKEGESSKTFRLEQDEAVSDSVNIHKDKENSYIPRETVRTETDDHGYDELSRAELGMNFLANESKRVNSDSDSNDSGSEIDLERGDYYNRDPDTISRGGTDIVSISESRDDRDNQQQKAYYLAVLRRLEMKGVILMRRLGMEHSLRDIKDEYFRIKKEQELESSVNFYKTLLLGSTRMIEFGSSLSGFGKLDGWTALVNSEMNSYETVLEEVYEVYGQNIINNPLAKLSFMLLSSAIQYHLSNVLGDTNPSALLGMVNNLRNTKNKNKDNTMSGPSMSLDDILDNMSDSTSHVSAQEIEIPIEAPAPKKRGRKPKKK